MNHFPFARGDRSPFRFVHPGALAAAGAVAAVSACAAAFLIFGPLSDERALQMAGLRAAQHRVVAGESADFATASPPVREHKGRQLVGSASDTFHR